MILIGGDKGLVAIWESDEMSQLSSRFADRVVQKKSDYVFDTVDDSGDSGGKIEVTMRDLDSQLGEAETIKRVVGSNKKKKNKNKDRK